MDEEMRFHIEAHAAELMKRGITRKKALRRRDWNSAESKPRSPNAAMRSA